MFPYILHFNDSNEAVKTFQNDLMLLRQDLDNANPTYPIFWSVQPRVNEAKLDPNRYWKNSKVDGQIGRDLIALQICSQQLGH